MHPRNPIPVVSHWKTLSGHAVPDLPVAVEAFVGDADVMIHVGTDSKTRGGRTDYVTAVAVAQRGRGGRIVYRRERHRSVQSLADRLFRETELSIRVALGLSEHLAQDIVIHVDANEDGRHRSARYVQALAGMVVGYGFQVRVKPDAWCATRVADYVVKEKHLRVA